MASLQQAITLYNQLKTEYQTHLQGYLSHRDEEGKRSDWFNMGGRMEADKAATSELKKANDIKKKLDTLTGQLSRYAENPIVAPYLADILGNSAQLTQMQYNAEEQGSKLRNQPDPLKNLAIGLLTPYLMTTGVGLVGQGLDTAQKALGLVGASQGLSVVPQALNAGMETAKLASSVAPVAQTAQPWSQVLQGTVGAGLEGLSKLGDLKALSQASPGEAAYMGVTSWGKEEQKKKALEGMEPTGVTISPSGEISRTFKTAKEAKAEKLPKVTLLQENKVNFSLTPKAGYVEVSRESKPGETWYAALKPLKEKEVTDKLGSPRVITAVAEFEARGVQQGNQIVSFGDLNVADVKIYNQAIALLRSSGLAKSDPYVYKAILNGINTRARKVL